MPNWGRNETVVWPPRGPVYTFGAVLAALLFTGILGWCRFTFTGTPLSRFYTPEYIRSAVIAGVFGPNHVGKYRILLFDGNAWLFAKFRDAQFNAWLCQNVFAGQSVSDIYSPVAFGGLTFFIGILPLAIIKDVQRQRQLKYGRRLKGPQIVLPRDFNKLVKGDGIGINTCEMRPPMRIPRAQEAQHFEIIGDTGSGKTTLIMQMLQQIQERGESAIVYDPACEFVRRFYDPGRGDVILNPLDARCPYWGPAEELRRKAEAQTLAASLYQPTSDRKGEFFTETPQQIFAHLLTFGPSPADLVAWMSNPAEIDKRVDGTEMAAVIAHGAQQQRNGVLASLGLIAKSLRLLPSRTQAEGRVWTATEWAKERKGWIFMTSRPSEREALRPLHSLWIDLLVLRLLNAPEPSQTPVWFVLDELASLQRLPQLHTAITENRKSKNPLILGFQGKAQLEVIYGHLAEVMLSQPATKIFLKTTEPKAAEWVSKAIGSVEIERMKETHTHGGRGGKSYALDRQIEPLVMDSEIAGLPNKHAFLKLGNYVARFSFEYLDIPAPVEAFVPRVLLDDELTFDPLTLEPKAAKTGRINPLFGVEAKAWLNAN